MAEPIIVTVRRKKAAVHSACSGLFALSGLAFTVFLTLAPEPDLWFIFMSFLSTLMFSGFALFYGGIALRAPVALRMDQTGISGFFTDPATWDEIKDVGLVIGRKRRRFLGFTLHDPVTFRVRQSAWRRFASWSSGRTSGHHIIVPELLLHDTSVDDLIAEAQRLRNESLLPTSL